MKTIKYLYYRGIRYIRDISNEAEQKSKEITYRGAKILENLERTAKNVIPSKIRKIYRGVSYQDY